MDAASRVLQSSTGVKGVASPGTSIAKLIVLLVCSIVGMFCDFGIEENRSRCLGRSKLGGGEQPKDR